MTHTLESLVAHIPPDEETSLYRKHLSPLEFVSLYALALAHAKNGEKEGLDAIFAAEESKFLNRPVEEKLSIARLIGQALKAGDIVIVEKDGKKVVQNKEFNEPVNENAHLLKGRISRRVSKGREQIYQVINDADLVLISKVSDIESVNKPDEIQIIHLANGSVMTMEALNFVIDTFSKLEKITASSLNIEDFLSSEKKLKILSDKGIEVGEAKLRQKSRKR